MVYLWEADVVEQWPEDVVAVPVVIVVHNGLAQKHWDAALWHTRGKRGMRTGCLACDERERVAKPGRRGDGWQTCEQGEPTWKEGRRMTSQGREERGQVADTIEGSKKVPGANGSSVSRNDWLLYSKGATGLPTP